jgi:hypothetical protein
MPLELWWQTRNALLPVQLLAASQAITSADVVWMQQTFPPVQSSGPSQSLGSPQLVAVGARQAYLPVSKPKQQRCCGVQVVSPQVT